MGTRSSFAHSIYENLCVYRYMGEMVYGVVRLGSRGNIEVFRMLSKPKYNITTRSMPIPPPACGGQPNLNASMYDAIFCRSEITKPIKIVDTELTTVSNYQLHDVSLSQSRNRHREYVVRPTEFPPHA